MLAAIVNLAGQVVNLQQIMIYILVWISTKLMMPISLHIVPREGLMLIVLAAAGSMSGRTITGELMR